MMKKRTKRKINYGREQDMERTRRKRKRDRCVDDEGRKKKGQSLADSRERFETATRLRPHQKEASLDKED